MELSMENLAQKISKLERTVRDNRRDSDRQFAKLRRDVDDQAVSVLAKIDTLKKTISEQASVGSEQ